MADYPAADHLIQQVLQHGLTPEVIEACLIGDYEDGGFSNLLVGFLQQQGVRMLRNERFVAKRGLSVFVTECVTKQRNHYKLRVESVDGIPQRCRLQCITTKYKKTHEGSESELFETVRNVILKGNTTVYEDLIRS